MNRLNRKIIRYQLAEAREQLESIESALESGKRISEGQLQVMFEHAYHHLNFAWNVRHAPMRKYKRLTDGDFNRWSKYPKDLEEYRAD